MPKSDLDVLIIGGYSLEDASGGSAATRSKIRLSYNNHLVNTTFIKHLVNNKGNLEVAEKLYSQKDKTKLVSRSLNTVYLYDFLVRNGIKTEAVNYFLLEREKFDRLVARKPKIVVISTTFMFFVKEITQIARVVKDISPNSIVVAGGIKILKSHKIYTLNNQGYFDDKVDDIIIGGNNFFFHYEADQPVDIFVIEECGERTLLDLIRKIKGSEEYKNTPNIAYYEKEKLVFTERIKEPHTFDKHIIAWDKVPPDILGTEIPVRAGMGCPFRCGFCDFAGLQKIKVRSVDSLIEELKLISRIYPGKHVFFTDDNLFITKQRTKELAEAIIKNDIKFKWWGFFRVDAISEDNVNALAKSGCYMCFLGVESGDDNVLKNMNKKITRKQVLTAVKLLNGQRINTFSSLVVGFPGETKDTVKNTIDLLNSYPDDNATLNYYYPFAFIYSALAPVTSPENRKKYGLIGGADKWTHNTMNDEQAREQLVRLFMEVKVPILPYPEEYTDSEIDFRKFKGILRSRQKMVQDGLNVLDENNVKKISETFGKIIKS